MSLAGRQISIEQPVGISGIGAMTAFVLGGAVVIATAFFVYYVPHYVLQYDQASYDVYWPRRFGLLAHLSGGTLALFAGPMQFWTGLRRKSPRLHRWIGRSFVLGVSIGVCGAVYLAITTTFGWAYCVGLLGLATAWVATTSVAFYAIRSGDVRTHKRWMVRAYTVTFAFVTARVFDDWLPTSQLGPLSVRLANDVWVSWAIPLLAVIVIQAALDISARTKTAG